MMMSPIINVPKMGPYSSFCLRKLDSTYPLENEEEYIIYDMKSLLPCFYLYHWILLFGVRWRVQLSALRRAVRTHSTYFWIEYIIYSLKWWNLWHFGRSCIILMRNVKLGREVSTKFTLPISSRPILIKTLWKVNFVQVTKAVPPVRISHHWKGLYMSKNFKKKKRDFPAVTTKKERTTAELSTVKERENYLSSGMRMDSWNSAPVPSIFSFDPA